MWVRSGLTALALWAVIAPSTTFAEGVGACAWAKAGGPEHEAFRAAYHQSIQVGMAQLSSADWQLRAYVKECAQGADPPKLWVQGAVGSQAIQDGAAEELAATLKISRSSLDAAWTQAPADARQCTRANAAKAFGINDQQCPDAKAPTWFLQRLGISPATDRADAVQALYYFNAKAQDEWAEGFIARFRGAVNSAP